ncbi:hypothetical protein Bca4012_017909 [Brassica carinata]
MKCICEGKEVQVVLSRRSKCNTAISQLISEAPSMSPLQHTSRRRINSEDVDGGDSAKMVVSKLWSISFLVDSGEKDKKSGN